MALALISSPGAAAVGVVAGGGNKGNSRFLMRHLGLPPLLHPLVFLLATSLLSPWHLQTVTTSANTLSDSYFNHRADPFGNGNFKIIIVFCLTSSDIDTFPVLSSF